MGEAFQLDIKVDGDGAEAMLSRVRKGLSDRRGLHARIAGAEEDFTRKYVGNLHKISAHKSARSLGAEPTGHYEKIAGTIEGKSDADGARLVIPRATGLGRAFGDLRIKPKRSKFLTRPAHRRTYGRSAREFGDGFFRFTIVGGRYTALVFNEKGDPDYGSVAYWLMREALIPQNRKLLPSGDAWLKVASRVASDYVLEIAEGGEV